MSRDAEDEKLRERLREELDLYHAYVLGLLIGQPKLQAAARAEWETRRKEFSRG